MLKDEKGLTLIELLAVIAIVGILFVLLMPQINNAIDKSRTSGVQTDFRSYQVSLQNVLVENGIGNSTEELINDSLDKNLRFKNGISNEKNPWGNPYEVEFFKDEIIITSKKEKKMNTTIHKLIFKQNGSEVDVNFIGFSEDMKEEGKIVVEWDGMSDPILDAETGLPQGLHPNTDENDYIFIENNDNTITITGYKGKKETIVVPKTFNGKTIKQIESYAFIPKSRGEHGQNIGVKIKEVVLPEGVERIGGGAFLGNDIEKVYIPASVSFIDRIVFNYNDENMKIYVDKDNLNYKSDEENAGLYTKDGKTIMIGTQSSFGTNTYKNVEIIRDAAFEGMGITLASLPNETIQLYEWTFVANPNIKFDIMENHIAYKNGVGGEGLYSKDGKILYYGTEKTFSQQEYQDIEYIAMNAFYNLQLKEIYFPQKLKEISGYAFAENEIENIIFGESIQVIANNAFEGNNIKDIEFPINISYIGKHSFVGNPLQTYKINNPSVFLDEPFPIGAIQIN